MHESNTRTNLWWLFSSVSCRKTNFHTMIILITMREINWSLWLASLQFQKQREGVLYPCKKGSHFCGITRAKLSTWNSWTPLPTCTISRQNVLFFILILLGLWLSQGRKPDCTDVSQYNLMSTLPLSRDQDLEMIFRFDTVRMSARYCTGGRSWP